MTKVQGAPPRKDQDPKNVQGPRRQNVERIQDNLVVPEKPQISSKIVPNNPDKNNHNHMSQSKKESIVQTNIATDRVGQFFSQPHKAVRINLQQSIQRPRHSLPQQSQRQSFNRNVNTNHPGNRIVTQHQTALPQTQRKILPSPTIHRTTHNAFKSNNHQFTNRPRHDLMFAQLKASNQPTVVTTSTSKKVSETSTSQQTKANNDQPILLNFEDFEDQAKTAKPRFIDPEEIENFGHDQSEHHSNSTNPEHMGDHGQEHHEDKHNTTQNENPHGDQQFCVDISEYLDLKWVIKDSEECHVTFTSQCETKSENVCIDVTETKCEVVPYKECKMGLEPMEYTEKKLAPKLFVEKSCYEGKKTIPHKKHFPECHNVTKQNCVTLWETDDDGEQVIYT